jgi:hypothetical protein
VFARMDRSAAWAPAEKSNSAAPILDHKDRIMALVPLGEYLSTTHEPEAEYVQL